MNNIKLNQNIFTKMEYPFGHKDKITFITRCGEMTIISFDKVFSLSFFTLVKEHIVKNRINLLTWVWREE